MSPPPPIGAARYRWRSAPEPTGEDVVLGFRSGGSRVHSPPSSFRLRTDRRISVSTCDGYSSRSQPLFVMWRGVWARRAERVKRPGAGHEGSASQVHIPRSCARARPDSAGRRYRTRIAGTARTASLCRRRCGVRAGTSRTDRPADPSSGGGEGGIRTHEVFRLSAFQERRHQPLGHLSGGKDIASNVAARPGPSSCTSSAGRRPRPCPRGGPSSRVVACPRRSR